MELLTRLDLSQRDDSKQAEADLIDGWNELYTIPQACDQGLSVGTNFWYRPILLPGPWANLVMATDEPRLFPLPSEAQTAFDQLEVRALIARGQALCDAGDALSGIERLQEGFELSRRGPAELHFEAALAVFNREGDCTSPSEALPGLSRLRQLALTTGDASCLGALHVAVARAEGFRGHCVDAYRHLEIARRLFGSSSPLVPRPWLDTIESSLELVAGNLVRAKALAESAFEYARASNLLKYTVGSGTNIALVALWTGNSPLAKSLLEHVLSVAEGYAYVRIGATDNLAQVALFEGDLDECAVQIERRTAIIGSLQVPARSWYDLASQHTSCAYFERLENWRQVISIADELDEELSRRQLKAVRTALLCAKARALSRLECHSQAETALALAMRSCPRGAIDPLIVLEASQGLCLSLKGDIARGSVHFDRALAACRAIGHRYHERWINRDRRSVVCRTREVVHVHRHELDPTDAALLVSDAAAILGAGRSIDLLAHAAAEILKSSMRDAEVDVANETTQDNQLDLVAWSEAGADGTFAIRLRRSDRLATVRVRNVRSLDQLSLVRGVAELVRVAVSRTAETESEEDDQSLWPKSVVPASEDAIFHSPRMAEILKIAIRLAGTDLPILIGGETGTGKEVFARLIHEHSRVKRGPFVAYNCSAMPRDLVESQLFGHRRGAFTGATDSFPGLVRAAEHGTLFLDEIGDLDLGIQPKMLRFLEGAEIHPLGELKPQRVPVRIVAATNADLDDLVDQGRFRRDLFYRIGVARLSLPPLRERKDEIPSLAALFLTRYSRECRRAGVRLGDDLIAALLLYDWPGNIRQLANEIRRIVALAEDGQTLGSADVATEISKNWNARPTTTHAARQPGPSFRIRLDQPLDHAVEELERTFIQRAMDASDGRVAEAARLLGISRKGLFLKRRRWGLVDES